MFTKATAVYTLASLAGLALAQPDGRMPPLNPDPKDTNNRVLVGKQFLFRELPYQVDTTDGDRGRQDGYNRCNDTTKGPESKCQTLIANSVQDFCLFGPQTMGLVGDTEGTNVAYCSQDTHGARLMQPGTLQGVQYIRTPSYTQIVGFIDQEKINIIREDEGGELDSGGADQRGNPIGAQVFSNSLSNNLNHLTQARMWHMFMGSNMFCLKMCHEDAPNASGHCRHTFDTIGCYPSNPADYENIKGKFLSCLGDDGNPVTPDNTLIPKTSQCVTYESAKIYPTAPGAPPATTTDAPAPSQTPNPGAGGGAGESNSSAPTNSGPASPGAPATTPVPKPAPTTTKPLTAPSPSQSQPGDSAVSLGASSVLAGVVALVLGAWVA